MGIRSRGIDGHFFLAYVQSIKDEILANPVLAACRNAEQLENECDIWALGDIADGHYASEMIKQKCTNEAMNVIDDWLQEIHANKDKTMHPKFPYFDYALPVIDGFKDVSWHNDVCPSLANDDLGLKLFCDFDNPSLRECGGNKFTLYLHDVDDSLNDVFIASNDDLGAILQAIESFKTRHALAMGSGNFYEIQTRLFGDTWENIWCEGDEPIRFLSTEYCAYAIQEHISESIESASNEVLDDQYTYDQFRIIDIRTDRVVSHPLLERLFMTYSKATNEADTLGLMQITLDEGFTFSDIQKIENLGLDEMTKLEDGINKNQIIVRVK